MIKEKLRLFSGASMCALGTLVLMSCEGGNNAQDETQTCLKLVPSPIFIKTATITIGSDVTYPEERPARQIRISAFDIDVTEVTNAQFAEFVKATKYVTDAERAQPGFGAAGAAVFKTPTATHPNWWQFVEGANWRHPEGPDSNIVGRDMDPVVQVTFNDARAYADWTGRQIPTEAEWEYAAGGGATTLYVWGNELTPKGEHMANYWQGAFPLTNTEEDGFARRAPVGCFPQNAFGLYDMIGNVWEWTATEYQESASEPIMTIKGGSYLCAENYCRRYRAAARQAQEAGLPTNHIGFRTVARAE